MRFRTSRFYLTAVLATALFRRAVAQSYRRIRVAIARINAYLVRWIRKKYKRLRAENRAIECWQGITVRYSRMFAHWEWVPSVARI